MTFLQRLRRPFRYTQGNANLVLIGVNILVFAITSMSRQAYVYLSLIPGAIVEYGWVWQFFTYMFVHAGFDHLFFNMFGLLVFGSAVERALGSREYLFFYLLTGTLAGAFSFGAYALGGAWATMLVGASGAVYAVLLAFAVINPRSTIFVLGVVPVPAPLLVAGYAVLEVFNGIFGLGGNVAHLTHLAGFGFAAAYFPLRQGVNPLRRLASGR